eukprot:4590931-Pyramimonas_sp.AAC.1
MFVRSAGRSRSPLYQVTALRPAGLCSPNRMLATASPAASPGYQASSIASRSLPRFLSANAP